MSRASIYLAVKPALCPALWMKNTLWTPFALHIHVLQQINYYVMYLRAIASCVSMERTQPILVDKIWLENGTILHLMSKVKGHQLQSSLQLVIGKPMFKWHMNQVRVRSKLTACCPTVVQQTVLGVISCLNKRGQLHHYHPKLHFSVTL